MIPRRRSGRSSAELLGVGPDARQRRLEVVADAAQEVVLRRVELEELGVLRLDLGEQLGVPDRDRDLAREQLEQVLVGALPAPRRRQVSDQDARASSPPARRTARIGTRLAGDALLDRDRRAGRRGSTSASIIPNALRASWRPRAGDELEAVPRRAALDRREDPAELPVPPLEVGGEPVVALGEAGELVLARRRRSGVERSPAEARSTARRDRPQRRGQVRGEEPGEEDREDGRQDEDEEQQPPDASPNRGR